jgi:ABC-2 type transport system ATP-binding protein
MIRNLKNMKEKVIEVSQLTKRYGNIIAIDNISFDVYQGEVFSLVGPNGAGKTTTVEILECLRKPTSGFARVLGYDILKDENKIKKRIGIMPQNFNAFERLTVKENIELIAKISGSKTNINEHLKLLGLWDVKDKKFGTLSGGMKRRVGICMALITDPDILFLDEPTTGLDPQARKEVWTIIKNLRKSGKTIFLTTHYMDEVEILCDRASLIVQGKIIHTASINELILKYGSGIRIIADNKPNSKEILHEFTKNISYDEDGNIVGKFSSLNDANKAFTKLYENGIRAHIIMSSMDDVFLNITGKRINEKGELI